MTLVLMFRNKKTVRVAKERAELGCVRMYTQRKCDAKGSVSVELKVGAANGIYRQHSQYDTRKMRNSKYYRALL